MRRNGTTWLNNPARFHSSIMHQDSGDKRAFWMRRIRLIWTELVLQAFATQSEWGLVVGIVGVYMPSCVRAETACLGMTRAWRTHACIQMWLVHHICYFVEKHEMHTCAIQVILINALTRALHRLEYRRHTLLRSIKLGGCKSPMQSSQPRQPSTCAL